MRLKSWWTHSSRERGSFRAWLHGPNRQEAYIELAAPSHSWCSFGLTLGGDEHGLKCHVALLKLGAYWGCSARRLSRHVRHQEWGFAINDGYVRLECGADPHSWSRRQPWWWSLSFEPAAVLFGRTRHSEVVVSRTETVVPMPERAYPCVVEMKDERWQRARLPWASHRIRRAHIDIPNGIPVPGKGENSWDCGDDATFSLTCSANTVEEGVAKVVESCLRQRRRYGGSVNWHASA